MGLVRTQVWMGLAAALVGAALFFAFRNEMPEGQAGADAPTAADAHGALMISPDTIDFGELVAGQRDERSIIVTNTGEDTLFVSQIEPPEGFTIAPASLELAVGESRAVTLQYAPTEPVAVVEEPLLFTAVHHAPHVVPVSAIVRGSSEIHIEPLAISFGRVHINGKLEASLTIENRGHETLSITGLATTEPFSVLGGKAEIAAGESSEITVGFNPETAGPFEGQLAIKSSDRKVSTIVVSLKGNGALEEQDAQIAVGAETLEFGEVPVGTSAVRHLDLTNRGRDSLTISRIAVGSPCDAPKSGWRIAPGSTYRVGFRFRPEDTGAALCPVTIFSNDPNQPSLVVPLMGEGTERRDARVADNGGDDRTGPEGNAPEIERVDQQASNPDGGPPLPLAASDSPSSEAPGQAIEDDFDGDEELDFASVGVSVTDDSRVYMGTQSAQISVYDIPNLNYDEAAGRLSGDGIVPAPIDFALGDHFRVEVAPFDLQVNAVGHIEPTPINVTLIDRFDTRYPPFQVTVTTQAASGFTTQGNMFTVQGASFESGAPVLVAAGAAPADSPAGLMAFSFEIGLDGVGEKQQ